jgi:hypothetical protein
MCSQNIDLFTEETIYLSKNDITKKIKVTFDTEYFGNTFITHTLSICSVYICVCFND